MSKNHGKEQCEKCGQENHPDQVHHAGNDVEYSQDALVRFHWLLIVHVVSFNAFVNYKVKSICVPVISRVMFARNLPPASPVEIGEESVP